MSGARFVKPALAALCLMSVSACVSLLPEAEPVAVYRLSAPEPREWSGEDWTIVQIEPPQAPRGLAGDEIALVRNGQSLAYIRGARWISPAPSIVQNLVIDSFNAAQSQLAPARPEDGVRADYELRLDLREFEAAYDQGENQAPAVRVRIAARLVAERGRRFVAARVFTAEVRAGSNRTGAIVDAFDRAASEVCRDIAAWTAVETAG
ncbi:ABC-type transport auxiliary lipoprotein family protein [Maricaulis sp.]|uniref:ABC-type transport auxiliary lipoprotein family protein n=1 Tax=Maricaulis sp. TaxID=1486257 RepID=UPI00260F9D58|nr:ABC-type transport auxiliary lipoprotein family protein [Maricaulis sp.]